jgi:hypothetical protein
MQGREGNRGGGLGANMMINQINALSIVVDEEFVRRSPFPSMETKRFNKSVASNLTPSRLPLGAAATHATDMVRNNKFPPGNAGVIFYTDILLPQIGRTHPWLQYRHRSERQSSKTSHVALNCARPTVPGRRHLALHDRWGLVDRWRVHLVVVKRVVRDGLAFRRAKDAGGSIRGGGPRQHG